MSESTKLLLWGSVGLAVYVYLGYPVLIALLSQFRADPGNPRNHDSTEKLPLTTVIIPVYNEERWIERKIQNTLALNYPLDHIQILVASDGSTDRTVEIARHFSSPNVYVAEYSEHTGKIATLNRAVSQACGEILIVTDANALLNPDAIQRLVPYFRNPGVGCVSGDRVCPPTDSPATRSEGLYWRYEAWIKRSESRYRSCLGAYGQLYSVRRSLFPFIPGTSDDFYVPMSILVSTGARTIFEPCARASVPAAATLLGEFRRKVRTHVALLRELPRLSPALIPWRSKIWWEFCSHHVLRLFIPWAMLASLGACALLWREGPVYRLALSVQVILYVMAGLGLLLTLRKREWGLVQPCFYFVFVNAAVAVAWFHWLRGESPNIWQKTQRSVPGLGAPG